MEEPIFLDHNAKPWHVYIILCSDGSLYTGITTDMDRRLRQHAGGKGAKYFRGREPLKVVYHEGEHTRSSAGKREAGIKAMNRAEKALLVVSEARNCQDFILKGNDHENISQRVVVRNQTAA